MGLGTNSPSYALDISLSTGNNGIRLTGVGTMFYMYNRDGTSSYALNAWGNLGGARMYDSLNGGSTWNEDILLQGGKVGIGGLGGTSPTALTATLQVSGSFIVSTSSENTTPTIYAGTNGNVGIGTTAPSQPLEVKGRVRVTALAPGDASSVVEMKNNAGSIGYFYLDNSGNYFFQTPSETTGTPAMALLNGGNVGIGTISPSFQGINTPVLTLANATGSGRGPSTEYVWQSNSIPSSSEVGVLRFMTGATPAQVAAIAVNTDGSIDSGQIKFFTQAHGASITQVMSIQSSGNVGISTTNPNATLDVNGTISATNVYVTATTGTVSATYGYFKYISASSITVGSCSGCGGASGDRIVSGTSSVVVNSATSTISVTVANVTTGYFDSSGRLVVPGISVTTAQTSVTSLYASGGVGIGLTGPVDKLSVQGTSNGVEMSVLRLSNNGSGPAGSGIEFAGVYSGSDPENAVTAGRVGGLTTNAGTKFGNLIFETSNGGLAERMRIDGYGNVGISTTTATYPLEVNGIISATGLYVTNTTGTVSATYGYFKNISASSITVGSCSGCGGASGDRIVSGTSSVVVNSATSTISFTTAGVVSSYIDSSGRHVVPGISVTTAQTSVTSLYASGNIAIGATSASLIGVGAGGIEVSATVADLRLQNTLSAFELESIGSSGNFGLYDVTEGAYRLYVTSSTGYIGISTTTPNASLDVNGTISATNVYVTATTGTVSATYGYFKNISASSITVGSCSGCGGASGDRIVSGTSSVVVNSATSTISVTVANVTTGYFDSSGRLVVPGVSVTTAQTSVTSLYASGGVGIGTTGPAGKLDVEGGILTVGDRGDGCCAQLNLDENSHGVGKDLWSLYANNNGNFYIYQQYNASGAAGLGQWFNILNNGNVGIGTTAPVTQLANTAANITDSVGGYGLTATSIGWSTSATGYVVGFANLGTSANENGFVVNTAGAGSGNEILALDSGGTNRFLVRGDGNVGIGTTNPNAKLEVNGLVSDTGELITGGLQQGSGFAYLGAYNTQGYPAFQSVGTIFSWNFTGGSAENDIWNAVNPATWPSTGFRFLQQTSATTARDLMFIRQDGNVGIGTTSPLAPNAKLEVNGIISATGLYVTTTTGTVSATYGYFKNISATSLSVAGATLPSGSGAAGYAAYWSGTNTLSYDNTANGQFYWDSTNHRLGIGTAAPDKPLEVSGSAHIGNDLILTRTDGFATASIVVDNASTTAINLSKAGGGNINSITLAATTTTMSGNAVATGSVTAGANAILCSSCAAGYYQDGTNGAYRAIVPSSTTTGYYFQGNSGSNNTMYVGLGGTYNGRVGIDNVGPAYALDVAGDARANSFIVNGGGAWTPGAIYSDANWGMLFRPAVSGSIAGFGFENYGSSATLMSILNSGNVGIGTTTPGVALEVHGSAAWGVAKIIGTGTNVESDLAFRSSNVSDGAAGDYLIGTNIGGTPANTFSIYNPGSGANVFAISATSGYVGIGTTNPYAKLEVNGLVSSTGVAITNGDLTINSDGGVYRGNGDNANFSTVDTAVESWWGLGFKSTCCTSVSATYPIFFDTRSGYAAFAGTISASSFVGNGSGLTGITPGAAGTTTQMQYNNNGTLAGGAVYYVSSSGNLGVGQSAPNGKLDVYNTGDNGDGIVIAPDLNGDNSISIQSYIDTHWSDRTTYASGCCNVLNIDHDVGTVHIGNTVDGDTVDIDTNLFVANNLTFTPANPSITSGGSYITVPYGFYLSGGTTYDQTQFKARAGISNDTGTYLELDGGTSSTTYVNGSLGVATSSPGEPLDVNGIIRSNNDIISSAAGADGGNIRMIGGNYGAFFRNDGSYTYLLFTASGSQYSTWNTLRPFTVNDGNGSVSMANGVAMSGGVTVDTLTASGLTYAQGGLEFPENTWMYAPGGVSRNLYIGPADMYWELGGAGSFHFRNSSDGDIATIDLSGNIHAPSVIYTSDRRLKKNIRPLTGGLAIMDGLNPVRFNWIKGPADEHVGLIAQDVQKVVPEAVSVGKDASQTLAVDYPALVPVLVEAIKELKADNDNLHRELNELRNARH